MDATAATSEDGDDHLFISLTRLAHWLQKGSNPATILQKENNDETAEEYYHDKSRCKGDCLLTPRSCEN
ncbi:hypothetical protein R3I93_017392 [Phoxinus phoxinus]|uniref:Uncharacterized protein n=1 Tax=Phoxinus phoxinus TaxID=58324 RepID=A0AAN9CHW8_9TELE